jgi:hypothetical protein
MKAEAKIRDEIDRREAADQAAAANGVRSDGVAEGLRLALKILKQFQTESGARSP